MNGNKRDDRQKSNPIAIVIVIVAAAATMLENVAGGRSSIIGVVIVLGIVGVVAGLIYAVIKKKQAEAKENESFNHSHDRLNKTAVGDDCSVDEHWKNQLEGFVKAGIIDRSEYQVLLRRQAEQADRIKRWQERR